MKLTPQQAIDKGYTHFVEQYRNGNPCMPLPIKYLKDLLNRNTTHAIIYIKLKP